MLFLQFFLTFIYLFFYTLYNVCTSKILIQNFYLLVSNFT
uniref:Uncharacterized protein n=1 Tax=Candidatus Magnetananas rongchengensis TaxID=1463558 RepID=A0A3Q8B165_9BACT|nr:hypothetical protein [Candidatus Magnetananas rongchenensis]